MFSWWVGVVAHLWGVAFCFWGLRCRVVPPKSFRGRSLSPGFVANIGFWGIYVSLSGRKSGCLGSGFGGSSTFVSEAVRCLLCWGYPGVFLQVVFGFVKVSSFGLHCSLKDDSPVPCVVVASFRGVLGLWLRSLLLLCGQTVVSTWIPCSSVLRRFPGGGACSGGCSVFLVPLQVPVREGSWFRLLPEALLFE